MWSSSRVVTPILILFGILAIVLATPQLSSINDPVAALASVHGAPTIECGLCTVLVEATVDAFRKDPANIDKFIASFCDISMDTDDKKAKCKEFLVFLKPLVPIAIYGYDFFDWNGEAVCAVLTLCTIDCCETTTHPEQIYVTFGQSSDDRTVVWVSHESTDTAQLRVSDFSTFTNSTVIPASTHTYENGGWKGKIHHATIRGVRDSRQVYYQVGNHNGNGVWSEPLFVKGLPANIGTNAAPLRIIHVADVDVKYGVPTIDYIEKTLKENTNDVIHAVLITGDIGYFDGYERRWDEFGRTLQQKITKYGVPILTTVGNHEFYNNFTAYKARFPRQTNTGEMYYSIDLGPLHLLAGNAELDIVRALIDDQQQTWMHKDLRMVSPKTTKWVVTAMHRPLYCTSDQFNCKDMGLYIRNRIEDIWSSNHVDLALHGHMHAYERTHQLLNDTVVGYGSTDHIYPKGNGPIYVVNGAGGNREGKRNPTCDTKWCAIATTDLGIGVLTATDDALNYEFIDVIGNETVDNFTVKG